MKIDSHQHFWQYNLEDYSWISDEVASLKRDFLPADLEPLLKANNMDGCIAVQARQSLQETQWLLELAENHNIIKGVVGWMDLCGDKPEATLKALSENSKLVGMRHVVQDEPDDYFMLRKDFINGISLLEKYGLTYDILIFPKQLPAALELAKKFPNQALVIDHIAKPAIASGEIEHWQKHIRQFKNLPNVYCKVSGMVTEVSWQNWTQDDFTPYLDIIVETFGTDRIMFGSDWPVCLLAADYGQVSQIVKNYLKTFSQNEQDKIFGINCSQFYLKD
ncbi:amidohydrolase family protein [Labilibacter marinus]|uniref:amidohydrolase family protein n=1 Tax=Labilibacter marinus TaxID=1477105 RepID=UPI00082D6C00|nr:amidohydrolase family protein [Labilibacter marinus]